ncbi:DUF1996 domain-containing protein [Nonomuraea sp. C10]|nr:DUF1996 domain-containing protein [Nonomuraea sp. C10]
MAAAISALAVVAGGLVSAVVVGGAQPAFADCEITEQRPPGQQQNQPQDQPQDQPEDQQQDQPQDQPQQSQAPQEQDQENQGRDDDQQGQDQGAQQDQNGDGQQNQENQNQNDQQGQDQGAQQDQQDQNGGGALVDPPADPEASAETFGQRNRDQDRDRRRNRPRPSQQPSSTASPSPTGGQESDCLNIGPFVTDFVDIRQIPRSRQDARIGRGGSRGTFVSRCGTNGEGHFNPDNFIVAPGVRNGAHHLHDYVGNLSADAFSTDESLEAAGTTCRLGDKSTYFWPVLRDRTVDENVDDPDRNVGQVLRPRSVTLQFRGNARARVVAMPRFLRIITGDAKAATNGPANARAGWSCSGFTNRISSDKYPLCPRGSQVLRIMDFPSCWDGQNNDSANHRTHIVFPDQSGACPQGTQPVPQLRMTLAYSVPRGPSFALDAFPEQLHNPVTDHGDFVNVMPERLMSNVVNCINRGRRC